MSYAPIGLMTASAAVAAATPTAAVVTTAAPLGPNITDTLIKLAQLGFIGAAVALFLLGAVVLIWGKQTDEAQAKTKRLYLVLAFLAIVVAGASHMWDTRHSGMVVVYFSPSVDPLPTIYNGTVIHHPYEKIDISDDQTLMIGLDQMLQKIRDLDAKNAVSQRAVVELASQNGTATGQPPISIKDGG